MYACSSTDFANVQTSLAGHRGLSPESISSTQHTRHPDPDQSLGRSDCDGRRIPIIGSSEVDPQFGTGCLKITPGHDPTDFAVGRQNGLPVINIMRDDGHLNGNALAYEGLERLAARKAIWKDLQASLFPSSHFQVTGNGGVDTRLPDGRQYPNPSHRMGASWHSSAWSAVASNVPDL